jgi:accessory gene regulator protein AgrB
MLDRSSTATIVVTLVLFVVALFVKGFSHDLLLEAGVFLVSVKLILMGYKHEASNQRLQDELRAIRAAVEAKARTESGGKDPGSNSA